MDIVIFTGRMDVDELEEDKPGEFAEVVKNGKLEQYLVEPYQPIVIKAVRIFGWTALTLGFLIVLGIIYAMLFAYR